MTSHFGKKSVSGTFRRWGRFKRPSRAKAVAGMIIRLLTGLPTALVGLTSRLSRARPLVERHGTGNASRICADRRPARARWRRKADVTLRNMDMIVAELNIRLMHIRRLLEAAEIDRGVNIPRLDIDEYGDPEKIAGIESTLEGPIRANQGLDEACRSRWRYSGSL
jgi:hypothetical protein